jgi:LmbE family N-acetylglucosaminyl deacetylase
MGKLVVFTPHPDDETLGCGGLMAKKVSDGSDVKVVFLTDGRNTFSKSFGIRVEPSPLELKKIRRREAKRATGILGVKEENLVFLDIEDGHLKEQRSLAEKKIRDLINGTRFSEVYFPSRGEAHPDHNAAHDIIVDVVRSLDYPCEKYCYNILGSFLPSSFSSLLFYSVPCFLPFFLPAFLASILPSLLPSSSETSRKMSFPTETVHVDVSRYLHLKEKALNEYRSQTRIIGRKQRTPVLDSSLLTRFRRNEEIFLKCKIDH